MTDKRQDALCDWFCQQLALDDVVLTVVSADASFRRYFRYTNEDVSYILVDAPVATEKNHEFVEFSTRYAALGLDVPRVLLVDYVQGFLCLSDLGDQTLLPLLEAGDLSWYQLAINQLRLVAQVAHAADEPQYDSAFFNLELNLFIHWFCQQLLDLPRATFDNQQIEQCLELLVSSACEQPRVSVHRDFHSRNLMVRDLASLAIIDFQDTVRGPLTYDLASLLKDCYIKLPLTQRNTLLKQAYEQYSGSMELACDFGQFKQWFDLMGLQRHLKVCGIFSRLSLRDEKHSYLADLPLVVDYIIETCGQYPQMVPLLELFQTHIQPNLAQRDYMCAKGSICSQ